MVVVLFVGQSLVVQAMLKHAMVTTIFSPNRPTGPIWSSSCDVRPYVWCLKRSATRLKTTDPDNNLRIRPLAPHPSRP